MRSSIGRRREKVGPAHSASTLREGEKSPAQRAARWPSGFACATGGGPGGRARIQMTSAVAVGHAARKLMDRRMLVRQIGRERAIDKILQLAHQGDGVRRIETKPIKAPFAIDLAGRFTGPLRHVRGQLLFDLLVALYRVLL